MLAAEASAVLILIQGVFGCLGVIALAIFFIALWNRSDREAPLAMAICAPLTIVSTLIIVWSFHTRGFEFSDGARVGYVTKLSKKGFIWPTWEGEMQMGGINVDTGGAVSARTWEFSISSDTIASQLLDAMENSKRVKLHYKDYACRGIKWGSSTYDIVEVKQ